MWVDRNIFGPAVGVVMSQIPIEGRFGETFKKDRSEFSGRSFDPERLRAALPVMRDQTYALLSLARTMLERRPQVPAGGRTLPGRLRALQSGVVHPEPARRDSRAARPAARHRRLVAAHEGAGRRQAQPTSRQARRSTSPRRPNPGATFFDANDPSGLKAGQKISVTPDDTGRVPVEGIVVGLTPDRVSIQRSDPRVGDVVVHFPRAGFVVVPL